MGGVLRSLSQQERLNFLLTNRIPRHALTRFVGWLSRIESPHLTRVLIAVWRQFTDLDLGEAEKQEFASLQECFTRRLRPGVRPLDPRPDVAVSPCDAIVGECGRIEGTTAFQAKGFPYELEDLLPDPVLQRKYRDGLYVTLRLTSSMYHRFHAPVACMVDEIHYVSGDTWNVNPIALKRIERLYCRNERALVPLKHPATSGSLCLVPVAAILVASMRFTGVAREMNLRYRGPNRIRCHRRFRKGDEMGYFLQGSTIVVLATDNYVLADGIRSGARILMGGALLRDAAPATGEHHDLP